MRNFGLDNRGLFPINVSGVYQGVSAADEGKYGYD
jgi:hypothetical protein